MYVFHAIICVHETICLDRNGFNTSSKSFVNTFLNSTLVQKAWTTYNKLSKVSSFNINSQRKNKL